MAALGTIAVVPNPILDGPATQAITDYDVVRGRYLGTIATQNNPQQRNPELHGVGGYVVRMIRVVYRQLWPTHGQRFPQ